MVKRYISFIVFCVPILLILVIFSIPAKVEIRSVGQKPPFLFALFLSIILLALAIIGFYGSYLCWFQGKKSRANIKTSIEKLANRFVLFRLPIYNPTFLFWYIRITFPIIALLLLGFFFLVLFTAF